LSGCQLARYLYYVVEERWSEGVRTPIWNKIALRRISKLGWRVVRALAEAVAFEPFGRGNAHPGQTCMKLAHEDLTQLRTEGFLLL
jgi:hypothetical protein